MSKHIYLRSGILQTNTDEYHLEKGELQVVRGNAIDLALDKPNVTLMHVVNCQGVMGSGVAKEVKDRIPEAYEVYRLAYVKRDLRLGSISFTSYTNVVNLAAQDQYGGRQRHLNYGALSDCLCAAAHLPAFTSRDKDTVVVPYKMGSDRAGGSWEVVSEMLEYFFPDFYLIAAKI